MFVDQAIITVSAGKGGDGCVAFKREKYIPKGGPVGGDGGKGGDVILAADNNVNTLLDFRGRPTWDAREGGMGLGKQCAGRDADDLVVRIPAGTLVIDNQTNELIHDIGPGESVIIAKGGKGGFGNEHFKTSTNQAPKTAQPGQPGESRELRLELKLLADVGLVGKPNAGKSTLLAALTRATPKIADYPFTTLSPQLGIAELDANRRIVVADIPGLIEGAAEGAGLGHDFLRHIERTKILVHLLDVSPPDGTTPAQNYKAIHRELLGYSTLLAEKDELIVINKTDLLDGPAEAEEAIKRLRKDLKLGREAEVFAISGATRSGTRALLERLWTMLKRREETWKTADGAAAEVEAKPEPTPVGRVTDRTPKVRGKRFSRKSAKPKDTRRRVKGITIKAVKKVAKKAAKRSRAKR